MSNSSDNMNCDVHLHAEIELLKAALVDKQSQLIAMETACLRESDRQVELEDSIIAWQDKYDRLYESHKRVQKVNQNLEDKLLKLVDRNANERAQLTSDVATLSVRLAQANYNIATLQREIERYKTDMGLAIQLLQCKPDSFVSQKVTSLPLEMQSKVTQYMRLDTQSHSDSEGSLSGVGLATSGSYRVLPASDSPPPMCPFPPTAMVYSMRGLDEESGPATAPINSSHTHHHHHQQHQNPRHNTALVDNYAPNPLQSQPGPQSGGGGGVGGANSVHSTQPFASTNHHHHHHNQSSQQSSCNQLQLQQQHNSNNNGTGDMISPSLMARYLQDELRASELKHCDTCQCASGNRDLQVLADTARSYSVGTQTTLHGDANNALCLRCNSNLNSPSRTNSPYIMKLVKGGGGGGGGGGGVDSDAKSTYSAGSGSLAALDMTGYVQQQQQHHQHQHQHSLLLQPMPAAKRAGDDLTVNPILGHHRLCDRKAMAQKQREAALAAAASVELQIENELRAMSSKQQQKSVTATVGGGQPKPSSVYGNGLQPMQQQQNSGAAVPMDTASGSTNSLWSKTSSNTNNNNNLLGAGTTTSPANADGAKMFETFNRNLIKSIKSENPKVAGPRLCALRIQNGTSNILLDNIDTNDDDDDCNAAAAAANFVSDPAGRLNGGGVAHQPSHHHNHHQSQSQSSVVYTRRSRFLDEELDESKDIITSPARPIAPPPPAISSSAAATGALHLLHNQTDYEKCRAEVDAVVTSGAALASGTAAPIVGRAALQKDLLSGSSMSISTATNDRSPQLEPVILSNVMQQQKQPAYQLQYQQQPPIALLLSATAAPAPPARAQPATQSNSVSSRTADAQQQQQQQQHHHHQHESAHESAQLRRAQLSRVAEWVQSNHCEPTGAGLIAAGGGGGSAGGRGGTSSSSLASGQQPAALPMSPQSTAATSIDSGYKTKAHQHHQSATAEATSSSLSDDHKLVVVVDTVATVVSVPALAGVHRGAGDGRPEVEGKEVDEEVDVAATATAIDFAQMEYNVKQFLLKQNEWSQTPSLLATTTTGSQQQQPTTSAHRTETNL